MPEHADTNHQRFGFNVMDAAGLGPIWKVERESELMRFQTDIVEGACYLLLVAFILAVIVEGLLK
jgi:hypothetical protein